MNIAKNQMEIKLLRHNENRLREMRELANEIDERKLKVKKAAKIFADIFLSGGPGGKAEIKRDANAPK
jgi:hypothetical protein